MNNNIAISVKNVSKTFRIPHEKVSSLRGAAKSKEKDLNMGSNLCSTYTDLSCFSAIDRVLKCAIINLLKPPVLTLWAWRGFILQK